jgi:hypothetical protein
MLKWQTGIGFYSKRNKYREIMKHQYTILEAAQLFYYYQQSKLISQTE